MRDDAASERHPGDDARPRTGRQRRRDEQHVGGEELVVGRLDLPATHDRRMVERCRRQRRAGRNRRRRGPRSRLGRARASAPAGCSRRRSGDRRSSRSRAGDRSSGSAERLDASRLRAPPFPVGPPRSTIGEGAYHAATPFDRAHSAWCAPNIPTDGKRRSSSSSRASTLRRYAFSRRRTNVRRGSGPHGIGSYRRRILRLSPGGSLISPTIGTVSCVAAATAFGRVDERRVDPGLLDRGADDRAPARSTERGSRRRGRSGPRSDRAPAAPASGSARPRSRTRSSSRMRSSMRGSVSAPNTGEGRHAGGPASSSERTNDHAVSEPPPCPGFGTPEKTTPTCMRPSVAGPAPQGASIPAMAIRTALRSRLRDARRDDATAPRRSGERKNKDRAYEGSELGGRASSSRVCAATAC